MGVSRTPLREAVRQLTAIGLVENRPHRGVIVPESIGAALFEALAEVEGMIARLAARRCDSAHDLRLDDNGGEWLGYLHRACGNPVLARMAAMLWHPLEAVFPLVDRETRRQASRRLLAAVMDGDGGRAEAAARSIVTLFAVANQNRGKFLER